MPATTPTIYLIAGCNGAGKTTFAKEFLPKEVKCLRFLNADEIARGLSPLKPSAGAIRAARLLLTQVDEHLRRRETFGMESTLSGKTYSGFSSAPGSLVSKSNCITSGFQVPLRPSPVCGNACNKAGTMFRLATSAAASSAASPTCSTIICRSPRAGRFGTAAACPRNGSPFLARMLSNLCDH